jgi:photosystem II stability/assembly factor-like uncharacterized protein
MKTTTLMIAINMIVMANTANSQMWVSQNVNPVNKGYNFSCLSVVDHNTALGIGTLIDEPDDYRFNYISRTIDGGINWSTVALDTDWMVSSFQALSADTAWMSTATIQGVLSGGNYRSSIRKTTDGGQTWIKNASIPFDSVDSYCDFMHFFNSYEGVAFGDVQNGTWEVYYTSDGGIHWNMADSLPLPLSGEVVHDNTQYVLGDHIWAVSTKGRVFYSYDKGHKWKAAIVGNFQFPLMCRVAFFDPLEGIAVRYNYTSNATDNIYRTHDGGKTWNKISHTGSVYLSYPEGNLFIVPGSNIVISNGGGSTLYGSSFSADYGATWTVIDASKKYGVIDGKDWNSLWAGQYANILGIGGIAKWDGIYLGMNRISLEGDFSIYPNPATAAITISTLIRGQLFVLNLNGQEITQQKITQTTTTIDIATLPKGVFVIKIIGDRCVQMGKVIKQ